MGSATSDDRNDLGPQCERDFTEAPIFKRYGPSPALVQQVRWRNGATIPTRAGILPRGGNIQPRTEKQRANGRSRKK